jgi:hypothetical protein
MTIYAGLDVSDKSTHICVVDAVTVTLAITPLLFDDIC